MPRNTPGHKQTDGSDEIVLPNQITVVGRGTPSNFEFTVTGKIEMITEDPVKTSTIVSANAAEGAIEVGVQRFRFSGDLANIHAVDWNGVEGVDAESTPTIHVNYGASNQ